MEIRLFILKKHVTENFDVWLNTYVEEAFDVVILSQLFSNIICEHVAVILAEA